MAGTKVIHVDWEPRKAILDAKGNPRKGSTKTKPPKSEGSG